MHDVPLPNATNVVGFCVLFTQVAMFTYVTFLLADSPYHLSTAALGRSWRASVFGSYEKNPNLG